MQTDEAVSNAVREFEMQVSSAAATQYFCIHFDAPDSLDAHVLGQTLAVLPD
jgi:hypothetical protein